MPSLNFFGESFQRTPFFLLLSGFFYAFLSLGIASMIFPSNIGLVAVFFISIALIPRMGRLYSLEEILVGRVSKIEKDRIQMDEFTLSGEKMSIKSVFQDHGELVKAYGFTFIGILLAFSILTLFLPMDVSARLFGDQFKILTGSISGGAFSGAAFASYILRNMVVLLIVFILSLLFEMGMTFVIVWNASVWGVAFASMAKGSALMSSESVIIGFVLLMAMVFPHMILEAISYFCAAISGGLLNRSFMKEKFGSRRFNYLSKQSIAVLSIALVLLALAALIEANVMPLIG